MSVPTALILAFTIVFSPFSGIIAYIITYDEYIHHLDKKAAKSQALQMAFFTFIVFVAVGLVSGWVFNQFVNK
jgi:ABC-type sulfate transport system permease component